MRRRWIWDAKLEKLVEVSTDFTPTPRVHIISDYLGEGVNGMFSHADGKHYDSKAAYRKSLKEQGLIQVGNERPKVERKLPEVRGLADTIARHAYERGVLPDA